MGVRVDESKAFDYKITKTMEEEALNPNSINSTTHDRSFLELMKTDPRSSM
jgi:hypothetical protein